MKRIFYLFFIFMLNLFFVSCNINPSNDEYSPKEANTYSVTDGITLSLEYGDYPEGVKDIKLILENRTENVMSYGNGWHFEKYSNGSWKHVEEIKNVAFTDERYILEENDKQEFKIPTTFLKKELKEGHYRVTGCLLNVAENEENLYYDGEHNEYPPYQLEFYVDKNSVSPITSNYNDKKVDFELLALKGEKYTLPLKEDWQWYTNSDAENLYRSNGMFIWQSVEGKNGLVAILYRNDTKENEYLHEDDKLMLDIFDRKTGKCHNIFNKPQVEVGDVLPHDNWGFIIKTDNNKYYITIFQDQAIIDN